MLAACGATPNTHDETAGWSAQKIYAEAREEMRGGGWDKAIKLLETLEAKYPFGRYAQQAQIDVAYSHWKNNDLASALAACDRFIKLYPNHDTIDYVYYLRGLINFNEDLGLLGKVSRQDPTERDNRGARESFDTFKELLTRFKNEYDIQYYSGLICERQGKAKLAKRMPDGGAVAYEWLRDAMEHYEKAEAIRPPKNVDAILRWNTCVRLIMDHHLKPRDEEYSEPPLE